MLFLIFSSHPAEAKRRSSSARATCQAIILSDSTNNERLFGKNVNKAVLPASTTKVMTVLLAMEKLPLDKYVTVRHSLGYVQPSKINLMPGESYRVADLIYALLLNSANDASVVLAEAMAGSEANFARMMNQRARQLGARHTKFANSNGLPTRKVSQYTTAYDMFLIFEAAMRHSFFRQAITKPYVTIKSSAGRSIGLRSHNKILFSGWKRKVYGKTGYTRAAGACFVGTIQKGDRALIIGVFNCTNRWDVIKRTVSRYGGISL